MVDSPKRGEDNEHEEKIDVRLRREHRGAELGWFRWPLGLRDGMNLVNFNVP